jgi:hypothetical protein
MLYLLMFLQIGAMFYALRLHRRRLLFANILPASIAVQIFGIGTAFVAILKIILLISSTGTNKEKSFQEAQSEYVALWYIGKTLADQYPGKSLLVILAPKFEADLNQENRIKGLEEGLESKMNISYVSVKYVKPKRQRKPRPIAYSYKNLNQIIQANDENDVIISLIGLPINYYNMECWNKDLADIYAYRGYSWEVNQDIENGELTGYITINPNMKFKATKGQTAKKTNAFFEKHFLFVNKRNVKSMVKKFPKLFKLPR